MTHDHQLQRAILAELRHMGSQLGANIVVSVIADEVTLSGEVDSFTDKLAVAAAVAEIDGVVQVVDRTNVRLDLQRNERLLLAARRVIASADARERSAAVTEPAGISVSMHDGLLMVSGEIDWRQRAGAPQNGRACLSAAPANIADDIVEMLPRCFFSTARAVR